MGARRALLGLIPLGLAGLLVGCASAGQHEDTGFHVVSSLPADGADDVVESQTPELRLSSAADSEACTGDSVGLVALTDEGGVGYELDVEVDLLDNGNKLSLAHDEHFASGTRYAFVVRTGSSGCVDVEGRPLRPFAASFDVP
ncbi:MAG: Ig-like domain-containing protein [Proteobacteria bacterium]|nr:Ig-like domain-containing protein [Pseudomonadota bacterium]